MVKVEGARGLLGHWTLTRQAPAATHLLLVDDLTSGELIGSRLRPAFAVRFQCVAIAAKRQTLLQLGFESNHPTVA